MGPPLAGRKSLFIPDNTSESTENRIRIIILSLQNSNEINTFYVIPEPDPLSFAGLGLSGYLKASY